MFDNWPRMMGHLYQNNSPTEPAWILFQHLMENYPFLFSVLGNHDLWNQGTGHFLKDFFRQRGMLLRRSGGRFAIDTGEGEPITIAMRHIWQGNSMYSEAHALKRHAMQGVCNDDALCGFHFHKGELRSHVRPSDGRVSKLVQVSSFKEYDDYANDRGFISSAETHPVVWLVCDSREPVTSHQRVQPFYDFHTARAVMHERRGRNE